MIRTLILYYLNIKPTHGYEIQKFLQVSGADRWTKKNTIWVNILCIGKIRKRWRR